MHDASADVAGRRARGAARRPSRRAAPALSRTISTRSGAAPRQRPSQAARQRPSHAAAADSHVKCTSYAPAAHPAAVPLAPEALPRANTRPRQRASARATPRPRIRTSSARATAHVASPRDTTKPGGPPPRPREGARRRHAVRRAQVSGRSPRVRTQAAGQRPSRAECTLGWDASGVGRNPGHCPASNRAKSGRRRVSARPARLASSPAREGLAVHMTCDVGGQREESGKTAERVSGLGPPAGGRDRGRFT